MTWDEFAPLVELVTDTAGRKHLMFRCRVGICTKYWSEQPPGEGATFSVGSEDKYAAYIENEKQGDGDRIGLDVHVVGPNLGRNIAIAGHASNAPFPHNYPVLAEHAGRWIALNNDGIYVPQGQVLYAGNEMRNRVLFE